MPSLVKLRINQQQAVASAPAPIPLASGDPYEAPVQVENGSEDEHISQHGFINTINLNVS